MNTGKVHVRFWNAMSERYGRRWTEQYGAEASPAWRDLVNKFTLEDIKAALAKLGDIAPEFPPTLPQFETLLSKLASAKKVDTTNYVRGYWRSMIVHDCRSLLGQTFEQFEQTLIDNELTLGKRLRSLLDELESAERKTGQRTEGILSFCADRCREEIEAFQAGGVVAA